MGISSQVPFLPTFLERDQKQATNTTLSKHGFLHIHPHFPPKLPPRSRLTASCSVHFPVNCPAPPSPSPGVVKKISVLQIFWTKTRYFGLPRFFRRVLRPQKKRQETTKKRLETNFFQVQKVDLKPSKKLAFLLVVEPTHLKNII